MLEIAGRFRAEPVVDRICPGYRAKPYVLELAGCLRSELVAIICLGFRAVLMSLNLPVV